MTYPTNPIYKLFKNIDGVENCVLTEKNGILFTIPIDEANTDYQEYLEWVSKGNTAEEAD